MTCTEKRTRPNTKNVVFPPIGSLINDFFNTAVGDVINQAEKPTTFNPQTNVMKHADHFELQLALPGFSKGSVDLELREDLLHISSNDSTQDLDDQRKYRLREFKKADFKKVFRIPETVEQRQINANFLSGVLSVILPIKKEELPKEPTKISIT